jgi:hypothetical protein
MAFKAGDVVLVKDEGSVWVLKEPYYGFLAGGPYWVASRLDYGKGEAVLGEGVIEHYLGPLPELKHAANLFEAQQPRTGEKDEPAEPSEYERLRDFFFPRKPQPADLIGEQRLKEGRCPVCGELGYFHLSTMVCTEHGPY